MFHNGEAMIALLMFIFAIPTFASMMFQEGDSDVHYPCMYRAATWITRIGCIAMAITFIVGVTMFDMWC